MEKHIKMSVVVPTHGRVDLFKKTLESLIKQTTDEFEVIVTDDSSLKKEQDEIKALVEAALQKGLNVKYIFTEPNLRQAKNTNQGLRNTKGEYIRILHSDDLLAPKCIETEIKAFEEYKDYDFLSHFAILFKEKIKFNSNIKIRPYNIYECWLKKNIFVSTVLPTTLAFRRCIYDEIGGMDESYDFLCDWDFYFRILLNAYKKGRNSIDISKGLVGWRVHNNSTTGTMALVCFNEHIRFINNIIKIYKKYHILSRKELRQALRASSEYRYERVINDYKKYHNFELPKIPVIYKSEYKKVKLYNEKLKKHINLFLKPFKVVINWLLQPFSIIFYLFKLIIKFFKVCIKQERGL